MKKRNILYLLTIIVLLLSGANVFASTNNIVDFSRKGSITVTLINEEVNYVEGANIKIYKLADAYSNNSNLDFDYHEDLKICENAIKENKFNNVTLECIYNSSVESKELITNSKGKVIFEGLDLGLYLIEQTNKVDGYSKIEPFLMYIPVNENNGWIYEVDAEPKVDIIRLFDLTVKKEWNVISGSNTPNEVVIELLEDNEVIEVVTLNKDNNWEYTWTQIEASDKYSVNEINVPEGYTPTYKRVENTYIVTNSKNLVQTGRMAWVTSLLSVLGLILIVLGILYYKKDRNA